MATIQPLANQISIGGSLDANDLRTLAAEGVRSLVNLMSNGEGTGALNAEEEGRRAGQLGLRYLHCPVAPDEIQSPGRVDEFIAGLAPMPRPVHVHCKSGRRAGIYAAIALGVEKGLSGELALQQARQLGVDPGPGDFADFIKSQTDLHVGKKRKG